MKLPSKLGVGIGTWMALVLSVPVTAAEGEYRATGRYTSTKMAPTPVQQDPLQQHVTLQFPAHVKDVQTAIRYVLWPTGYSLPPHPEYMDDALVRVGMQKLPNAQRRVKGTVGDVLRVLAGPGFVLVRDDVRRWVLLDYIR